MVEKRFKFDSEVGFIDSIRCGGDNISNNEVCNLLNGFVEENEQLKSLCKVLIKKIEEKSIAFVIDEEVRRILND